MATSHPRTLLLDESSVVEQLWPVPGDRPEGPAVLRRKEHGAELTVAQFVPTNP